MKMNSLTQSLRILPSSECEFLIKICLQFHFAKLFIEIEKKNP